MRIPKNMTEQEVLEVIDKVANRLCYKFKFGYHEVDDMKQQARLFAIQGMDKYDESRPLENFLWTHVRNRLFNFKRDNFERPDKPCFSCPFYDPGCKASISQCEEFEDKRECSLYEGWVNRNLRKKTLVSTTGLDNTNQSKSSNHPSSLLDFIADSEILELIDKNIPIILRADYLRLKYGLKLPRPKKNAVINSIKSILKENDINYGEER